MVKRLSGRWKIEAGIRYEAGWPARKKSIRGAAERSHPCYQCRRGVAEKRTSDSMWNLESVLADLMRTPVGVPRF